MSDIELPPEIDAQVEDKKDKRAAARSRWAKTSSDSFAATSVAT
jgi:hypothetical protein